MLTLCYAGCSRISAQKIADASNGQIRLNRGPTGDVNWGRHTANTKLNSDISNSVNKRRMREIFKEAGVPTPKLYTSPPFCSDEYPVVGRPDRHTKGRGFWLCRDDDEAFRAMRGTRHKRAATHFMEYISAPHEYRVHVFNGTSIRISEKDFNNFQIERVRTRRGRTTIDIGFRMIKPTGRVWHVRKAAKAAVEALGLDFGAVDVLANDEDCWVTEVNAAPGLGGTMPQLMAETFLKWKEQYAN